MRFDAGSASRAPGVPYLNTGTWECEEEPTPSAIDTWARGTVPTKRREAVSAEASTLDSTASAEDKATDTRVSPATRPVRCWVSSWGRAVKPLSQACERCAGQVCVTVHSVLRVACCRRQKQKLPTRDKSKSVISITNPMEFTTSPRVVAVPTDAPLATQEQVRSRSDMGCTFALPRSWPCECWQAIAAVPTRSLPAVD